MSLQRTFSSFPPGWAGGALLVLRVTLGVIAMAEVVHAISDTTPGPNVATLSVAAVTALAALCVTLGFLTPIASALLAAAGAAMFMGMHSSLLQLLDSRMALFEFVVMAAALAVLGPGATSFDARLFGRREVEITPQDGVS